MRSLLGKLIVCVVVAVCAIAVFSGNAMADTTSLSGTVTSTIAVDNVHVKLYTWDGNLVAESIDEDGDGATVTVPEDTPVRHPHWTEISKAVWGPTVLPSREREELALSRTYREWRN